MPRRPSSPQEALIARNLRIVRELAGLPRHQVASAAGVSADLIEKVELGTRRPSPRTLGALPSAALGVTVAHLHRRLPAPARKDAKRPALARALRDGREKLNLSQPEVARRAGIPCATSRHGAGQARALTGDTGRPCRRAGSSAPAAAEGRSVVVPASAGGESQAHGGPVDSTRLFPRRLEPVSVAELRWEYSATASVLPWPH